MKSSHFFSLTVMGSSRPVNDISCSRCKVKKIRCNKVRPKCDKCDAACTECSYLPRKERQKRSSEKDVLARVLTRLDRLENHCQLDRLEDDDGDARSERFDSELNSPAPQAPQRDKDEERSQRYRDIFYQMRYAGPNITNNKIILRVLEETAREIEISGMTVESHPSSDPLPVSKETAKKWINLSFDIANFGVFENPLGREFTCNIADLLDNPHVKLDDTCLMIFYSWVLHGMILDKDFTHERGAVAQQLYEKCSRLLEKWRHEAQNTYIDFYAAFLMISIALEGCNIKLGWEVFSIACKIAKALGHFTIDQNTLDGHDGQMDDESADKEIFADKNRRRYEFWYLVQVDCIFRLYFGRPASIPHGSWAVKFPDPTINGVDDVSTHFLQIHFLATMRYNLVLLKFFDLASTEDTAHPAAYDEALDDLTAEVQSIMSNWKAEDLLETITTDSDMAFCSDILFNGYRILIVLQNSKKGKQQVGSVSTKSVEIARLSLTTVQTLIKTRPQLYWGTTSILLNQYIPFLTLCSNITSAQENGVDEIDLGLVTWISDNLGKEAEGQVLTSPIRRVMKALAGACQQIVGKL